MGVRRHRAVPRRVGVPEPMDPATRPGALVVFPAGAVTGSAAVNICAQVLGWTDVFEVPSLFLGPP